MNRNTRNSSKVSVLEVDLEYTKELSELHNDYRVAPDKIEIKRQMFSNYQIKVADFYNIPISNVKKLVPNFFFSKKKKCLCFIMKTCNAILRLGLKFKKIHRALKFNQSQWNELSSTHKKGKKQKNGEKYGNTLHKLITMLYTAKQWKT